MSVPSRDTVLDCARLSRAAYTDIDTLRSLWEMAVGKTPVARGADWEALDVLSRVTEPPVYIFDQETDATAYGIKYEGPAGKFLIIAFRGTSSLADALADGAIAQVPLRPAGVHVPGDVLVHFGFSEQFLMLERQCDAFLKGVRYPVGTVKEAAHSLETGGTATGAAETVKTAADNLSKLAEPLVPAIPTPASVSSAGDIIVIGHSLGSSVAAVAALVYALQFSGKVQYIGYGTPRVGNFAWAKLFNATVGWCTRVKQGRDPVDSCIPPVGYAHVGTPGSYIHVGKPDPFPDVPSVLDLPDHDMATYIANLRQGNTSETPLAWVGYIVSFLNLPFKLYYAAKNAALCIPACRFPWDNCEPVQEAGG